MTVKSRIKLFLLGAVGLAVMMISIDDDGSMVAREQIAIIGCVLFIIFSMLSKTIVKGNIHRIDLIRVSGYGELMETVVALDRESMGIVESMFAKKKACFYTTEDFAFRYALKLFTDRKQYLVYLNDNDIAEIKITKYCFGLRLNDREKAELTRIIDAVERPGHITAGLP